jgi:hypothetical protein
MAGMRPLVSMASIAAIGFVIGLSGTRWITGPDHARVSAPAMERTAERTLDLHRHDLPIPADAAAKSAFSGLVELLKRRPPSAAWDHQIVATLDKWTSADFLASADEFKALLKAGDVLSNARSCELADAWMDRWLQIDPRGAQRFLRSSSFLADLPILELEGWPMAEKAQSGLGGVFQALARRQPEWTREVIAEMTSAGQRAIGAHVLMNEVAGRNPALAERFLPSFVDSAERSPALSGYVRGLVEKDVSAGYEVAMAEPLGALREELLRTVFWRAGRVGVNEAQKLLDRIEQPDVQRIYAAEALSAIGFEQREDALPFIKDQSERMAARGDWNLDQSRWASSVEVVSRGPQARGLAEWALSFTADTKRTMFSRIAGTWSARDPEAFGTWLKENALLLDPVAVDRLESALANIARRDPNAALTWSETLPAGPVRDFARFQVAVEAGGDIDVERSAAAYQPVAFMDKTGAMARRIAASMVAKSGEAAAKWADQLPPGPARLAALETLTAKWSSEDPRAAADWLQRMPAGADRDSLVRTYSSQVAIADPRTAALWAEQVTEPALRTEAASKVYSHWSVADPIAARDWLRNLAGVDQSAVSRILRR